MSVISNLCIVVGMGLFVCSGPLGLVVFAGLFKILNQTGE